MVTSQVGQVGPVGQSWQSGQVTVQGLALAAAPVVLLAAQALDPTPSDADAVDLLATAADEATRWTACHLLFFAGAALLAVGAPAVCRAAPHRGRVAGLLASVLLALAAVCIAAWTSSMLSLAGRADARAPGRYAEAARGTTALTVIEAIWIASLMLGIVCLAVALLRSRSVPRWAAWCLLGFVAVEVLLVGINIAETTGFVMLAVGLGATAREATRPVVDPVG